MKTDQILLLDCTKPEQKEKLKKALLKIDVVRRKTKDGEDYSIDTLEKCLHGIIFKYGYRIQWLSPYYEEAESRGFVSWSYSLVKKRNGTNEWCGSLNARSLWEAVAKGIIQVYADIKAGEKENGK